MRDARSALLDAAGARTAAKSVLVVNGDSNLMRAIVRLLRVAGIPAITALDADEALYILARHRIAVLLGDALICPRAGIDVFRAAKTACPAIMTILLAGRTTGAQLRQARQEGVVHAVLPEQWENELLLDHVRYGLERFDTTD